MTRRTSTPEASLSSRTCLFVLAVIGLVIHGAMVVRVGYMADDFDLLHAARSPSYALSDAFPAGTSMYFRPLVMMVLRAEEAVAHAISLAPNTLLVVRHGVSLLVHIANAWLVFFVTMALLRHVRRDAPEPRHALLAALVFLLHPVVVSNVCWIAGRTDLFATMFVLASLVAALRALEPRGNALVRGAIAMLLFACALASKESALAVPGWWMGASAIALTSIAKDHRRRALAMTLAGVALSALWAMMLWARFYGSLGRDELPVFTLRSLVRGVAAIPMVLVLPNSESLLRRLAGGHRTIIALAAAMAIAFAVVAARRALKAASSRDDRAVIAGAGLVVVSAFAPPLLSGVNASSRLMYMPLAAMCIAGACVFAVLTRARTREGTSRWRWAWLLPLGVMAYGSLRGDHRWVDNSERTERYCAEYAASRSEAIASGHPKPALFVTYPADLDSVPLFSNDLRAALAACEARYLPNASPRDDVLAFAPVSIEGPRSAEAVTEDDEVVADVAFVAPDVIFATASRLEIVFDFEPREVKLPGVQLLGDSHVFEVHFASLEDRAKYDLFVFDGVRVRSLSPP